MSDRVHEVKKLPGTHIFHAVVGAPFQEPYLFLIFASGLFVFFSSVLKPEPMWLFAGCVAASWLFISLGRYRPVWDLAIELFRRLFVSGTAGIFSGILVIFALGALFEVQYVTTILYGGSLKSMVTSIYVVIWLYEYWISRFFFEGLFSTARQIVGFPAGLAMKFTAENCPRLCPSWSEVEISLLGSNRFLIAGTRCGEQSTAGEYRIFFARVMLNRLSEIEKRDHQSNSLRSVWRQLQSYFLASNVFLVFCFAMVLIFYGPFVDTRPTLTITPTGSAVGGFNFVEKLNSFHGDAGRVPVIVALSGGGTRAALNAASFLCGMSALGRLDDIVLISGVSGGSAAAAYFAMHRKMLLDHTCDAKQLSAPDRIKYTGDIRAEDATDLATSHSPWFAFYEAMSSDFINDVLRGTTELRIYRELSNGVLLAESFGRRFKSPENTHLPTLSEINDVGLIFNTTITGHPIADSPSLGSYFGGSSEATESKEFADQGGRLVFTNLTDDAVAAQRDRNPTCAVGMDKTTNSLTRDAGDPCFLLKVIDSSYQISDGSAAGGSDKPGQRTVTLHFAAAASANFPPVFSDFGIEVALPENTGKKLKRAGPRYWVTDGGALDNRGVDSVLLLLRKPLKDWMKESGDRRVQLLVVDSGALSVDFKQVRGISAGLSTAGTVMNQLIYETENSLGSRFESYYLPMPTVMRSRGAFGTHWKLPDSITLSPPSIPSVRETQIEIDAKQIKKHVAELFPVPRKNDCEKDLQALCIKLLDETRCADGGIAKGWLKFGRSVDPPQEKG